MQWSAMNHGDVFILDLGRLLYVWNGKEASITEKRMVIIIHYTVELVQSDTCDIQQKCMVPQYF